MRNRIFSFFAAIAIAFAAYNAGAANPLEALGGIVGQLTSSSKFDLASITGSWYYVSPAVSFKSDKALNKIGGAAAASAVEKKLEPYYRTAGLTNMSVVITQSADSVYTFELKAGKLPLKGTIAQDAENGLLIFKFSAAGKFSPGELSAKAEKDATGNLSLTFDATRFVAIITKVAGATNNASLKSISSLLSSYDGIFIGAKMKNSESSVSGDSAASKLGSVLGNLKKNAEK